VERRGYTAIILQWFAIGVGGIVHVLALVSRCASTAVRVLRRDRDHQRYLAQRIMSGTLSERRRR
jgi:hypothetical protein